MMRPAGDRGVLVELDGNPAAHAAWDEILDTAADLGGTTARSETPRGVARLAPVHADAAWSVRGADRPDTAPGAADPPPARADHVWFGGSSA